MVEIEYWSNDYTTVALLSPEDYYESDCDSDVCLKLTDDLFLDENNEEVSLSDNNFTIKG